MTTLEYYVEQLSASVCLPIDTARIPDFKELIAWNGFREHPKSKKHALLNHSGWDFAAYFNQRDEVVLGLPEETVVHAVGDGRITYEHITYRLQREGIKHYMGGINLHPRDCPEGFFIHYGHITPLVDEGVSVRKGQPIATLYKRPGNQEGEFVHLHLEVGEINESEVQTIDPILLFPQLSSLPQAQPQGEPRFRVSGKEYVTRYAHFEALVVNGFTVKTKR